MTTDELQTGMNQIVSTDAPILRSINSAIREIQRIDPGTQLTARILRNAIQSGEIEARKVGKNGKYLLDLNKVLDYYGCKRPTDRTDTEVNK